MAEREEENPKPADSRTDTDKKEVIDLTDEGWMAEREEENLKPADSRTDTGKEEIIDLTDEPNNMYPKVTTLRGHLSELRQRLSALDRTPTVEVTVAPSSSFDPVSYIAEITDGNVELAGEAYERARSMAAGAQAESA